MAVRKTFGNEKHPTTLMPRPKAKNKKPGSNWPPKPSAHKPGNAC